MLCKYQPGPFEFHSEPSKITVSGSGERSGVSPGVLDVLRDVFQLKL